MISGLFPNCGLLESLGSCRKGAEPTSGWVEVVAAVQQGGNLSSGQGSLKGNYRLILFL